MKKSQQRVSRELISQWQEYPSRPEPKVSKDEDDRVGFKVWEVAYVSKNRLDEKLAGEKIYLWLDKCPSRQNT